MANIEWNEPSNDPRGVSSGHVHIPTDGGIISRYTSYGGDTDSPSRNYAILHRGESTPPSRNYVVSNSNSSGNRDGSSGGGLTPFSKLCGAP